jgi:hypothetical protein
MTEGGGNDLLKNYINKKKKWLYNF